MISTVYHFIKHNNIYITRNIDRYEISYYC